MCPRSWPRQDTKPSGQSKTQNVGTRRERNVLMTPCRERHRGRTPTMPISQCRRGVGLDVPQVLSSLCIDGAQRSAIPPKKNDTAGREHTTPTVRRADLRYFPYSLPRLDVECAKKHLSRLQTDRLRVPVG